MDAQQNAPAMKARYCLHSAVPDAAPPVGRMTLLGLPVDHARTGDALEVMAGAVERRRSASARQETAHVVTLNPEMAMAAQRNGPLRDAIVAADLVVPDGIGIVLAARARGQRLPERVTGVDLLDAFAAVAAQRGYRLFLLGAAPGVAEAAGQALALRHPGLVIAGTFAGSPTVEDETEVRAGVAAAQADALFVAFGTPAQECWVARQRGQLGAAVAVGVGGAFDMLAGRVPRAPRWLRRVGLEWLYRLWREPWRWRRMLALPRFAVAVLGEGTRTRRRGQSGRESG